MKKKKHQFYFSFFNIIFFLRNALNSLVKNYIVNISLILINQGDIHWSGIYKVLRTIGTMRKCWEISGYIMWREFKLRHTEGKFQLMGSRTRQRGWNGRYYFQQQNAGKVYSKDVIYKIIYNRKSLFII